MSDALLAIARNAVALLDDAQFLFEDGRYPRAAALAVLAAEEAGKFWLCDMKPEGWQKMVHKHPGKIGVGASFHEAERMAGIVFNSTGDMAETFAGASSQPEYKRCHERTQALLPLKEASLYVDPDDDGNLASETPEAVGKDIAAKCIDYARAEVQRLWAAEIVRASLPPLPPIT
jgi:AbiV family abortive infection protein